MQVAGSAPYEALLVPDAAIGTEQARKYVLVVGSDNVARQKFVTLGDVVDGLRVIKSGLDADDRVIVNGLMQVRAGSKVAPKEQGAPRAGGSSASQLQVAAGSAMRLSHFFIDRPIFASVVSIVIVILGRGRLFPPAGRAVSRDRAAGDPGHRAVSRRQRRRGRGDDGRSDRGADQRRREHALHVVELDGGRPLHRSR